METNEERFLKHYGILGMKWGRRSGGSGKAKYRTPGSEDHERKIQLKGKRVKDMSNAELKEFANRLQLEAAYKKSKIKPKSKSRKAVEGIVGQLGKKALKEFVADPSGSIKIVKGVFSQVAKRAR